MPLNIPPFHPLQSLHPVVRCGLSVVLLVLAFSMAYPVLAVKIQAMGHSTAVVGAFAMIGFACVAVLIPVMPAIMARVGELRAIWWGTALELAAALAFAAFDSLPVWCLFALIGGCGGAACWNGTEALIARYSPPERRGRIAGAYQTLLGGVMALGPFLPSLWGWSAEQALWVGAAAQGLGLLVLVGLRSLPPVAHAPGADTAIQNEVVHGSAVGETLSTWRAFLRVPALAGLAFAGGVFEAGLSSVGSASAAATGLPTAQAITVAGTLGLGSFLLQLPAGLLADRTQPQRLFAAAGTVLLGSSLALLLVGMAPWVLWACAFCWGGIGGALYTMTMVRTAHQFKGPDTAGGTAAMILGYTLGGAVGPPVSGVALATLGMPGLALWLGLVALAVLTLARRIQGPAIHADASS
jgi:MFS family permease